MYNTQLIAERIKQTAKRNGYSMKKMLSDLDLGINIISQLSKGQIISSINLAKIADYLDCSVDYLLGRTSGASHSVAQAGTGNVNGNISNSTLSTADNSELSEYEADIIRVFRSLTPKQKNQVMTYIYDIEEQTPPINS